MSYAAAPRSILLFVAFIVFIDMMGIGLILPVMPALIRDINGSSICRAAEMGGWLLFAYATVQFLFASDYLGTNHQFKTRLGGRFDLKSFTPTLQVFLRRILYKTDARDEHT